MFDVDNGSYENNESLHWSFHADGHGHMKKGRKNFFKGQTSDGSPMNDPEKTLLILGIETFYLDAAPTKKEVMNWALSSFLPQMRAIDIPFCGCGQQPPIIKQFILAILSRILLASMLNMELFNLGNWGI